MIPMAQRPNYQLEMGRMLLANGGTRSGHPVADAVSQAGSQLLGAYMTKLGYDRDDERRAAANKTLADALAGAKDVKPWVNPDTGELMSGTSPNDYLAQALMGNEDTAGMGMQFAMNSLNQRSQSALDSAKYNRERKDKMDFYELTRNDEKADWQRDREATIEDREADQRFKAEQNRIKRTHEKSRPSSAIGKIESDLSAGLITQEQADTAIAALGKPTVSISNGDNPVEKRLYEKYEPYDAVTATAPQALETLNYMAQLVDMVDTGIGTENVMKFKQIASKVGFDVDDEMIANQEMLRRLAGEKAIDALQAFKGPTTDFEYGKVESMQANLSNTPGGNRKIIEYQRKLLQKEIALADRMTRAVEDGEVSTVFEFNKLRRQTIDELNKKFPLFPKGSEDGTGGNGTGDVSKMTDDEINRYLQSTPSRGGR